MINYLKFNLNTIKIPIFSIKLWEHAQIVKNSDKKYCFLIKRHIKKKSIKVLFEYLFNVKIIKITTSSLPPKKKKNSKNDLSLKKNKKKPIIKFSRLNSQYKKVIIRLENNNFINHFSNI